MTYDLSKHPDFTCWTDPESGVESYIRAERAGRGAARTPGLKDSAALEARY